MGRAGRHETGRWRRLLARRSPVQPPTPLAAPNPQSSDRPCHDPILLRTLALASAAFGSIFLKLLFPALASAEWQGCEKKVIGVSNCEELLLQSVKSYLRLRSRESLQSGPTCGKTDQCKSVIDFQKDNIATDCGAILHQCAAKKEVTPYIW